MSVSVSYVTSKAAHKFFEGASLHDALIQPLVLPRKYNFFLAKLRNSIASDWWTSNVASGVSQEMLLGIKALNLHAPPPAYLPGEQR